MPALPALMKHPPVWTEGGEERRLLQQQSGSVGQCRAASHLRDGAGIEAQAAAGQQDEELLARRGVTGQRPHGAGVRRLEVIRRRRRRCEHDRAALVLSRGHRGGAILGRRHGRKDGVGPQLGEVRHRGCVGGADEDRDDGLLRGPTRRAQLAAVQLAVHRNMQVEHAGLVGLRLGQRGGGGGGGGRGSLSRAAALDACSASAAAPQAKASAFDRMASGRARKGSVSLSPVRERA